MTRPALYALLAAAALVVAYWTGRSSATTRVIEQTRTVKVDRIVTVRAEQTAAVATATVDRRTGPTRLVTRWLPSPDCKGAVVVEQERVEAGSQERTATASSLKSSSTTSAVIEKSEGKFQSRETVREPPRFSISAEGGLRFTGETTAIVAGRFEVRPLPGLPFWMVARPYVERPVSDKRLRFGVEALAAVKGAW